MNRRQRRQQADATEGDTSTEQDTVPLRNPERGETSRSKGKTLYDIAAERQTQLSSSGRPFRADDFKGARVVTVSPNGTIDEASPSDIAAQAEEAEPLPPFLDSLFLASSLSALHFTLEVLTVHQYAEELRFLPIFLHTVVVAFPTLSFAIHLAHGHVPLVSRRNVSDAFRQGSAAARQLLFLVVANVAGCYLIYLTNDKGYYAVMKKAPSMGTIWVWCVLELGLIGALLGVAGPGLYAWYHGYGIF